MNVSTAVHSDSFTGQPFTNLSHLLRREHDFPRPTLAPSCGTLVTLPAKRLISFFLAVNVGFSYSNKSVTDSPTAAKDVYAFLQLFFEAYPGYAAAPFSSQCYWVIRDVAAPSSFPHPPLVAAESYGGIYAPHIATKINHQNKALESRARDNSLSVSSTRRINLSTVMIGNGKCGRLSIRETFLLTGCERFDRATDATGCYCYQRLPW